MSGKMKASLTWGIVNLIQQSKVRSVSNAQGGQSLALEATPTSGQVLTNKSKLTDNATQTQRLKPPPLRFSVTGTSAP